MSTAVRIKHRLRADCGRVEDDFCPVYGKASCSFREPLVPAYSYTNPPSCGIKDLKAGVSRCKIEFFLIEVVIRYMGFSVYTKEVTAIKHGDCVVENIAVLFVYAYREHCTGFSANINEMLYRLIFHDRFCKFIVIVSSFLAEVLSFKEFRKEDEFSALVYRLHYQVFSLFDAFFRIY